MPRQQTGDAADGELQPHPLAGYRDRIEADRRYTTAELAEVLEMAPSSITTMAGYGWLPGATMRPHARGGRMYTWTGKQLRRLAGRRLRVAFDHATYTPVTLYRVGCRCDTCIAAHSLESQQWRRRLADEAFPPALQKRLLVLVAGGMAIDDAAAKVGVSRGQVHGRAQWDPAFADRLDEAGWALCVLGAGDPRCGSSLGYRGRPASSVSPAREACRGTGCREWRREESRRERS